MRGCKPIMLMIILLGVALSVGVSGDPQQKLWKMKSAVAARATSSVVNLATSSVLFPLYGNVYPDGFGIVEYTGEKWKPFLDLEARGSQLLFDKKCETFGFYFVQVNVGLPPKPYFLDPDTGSDLSWIQCDAPCVHCTKAPHPPYRPTNDFVVCKDPLCASLHTGDYKCKTPEQCDYEVEYADGGSSIGVLVKDVFSLNLTNGMRLNPRLAFGCGYNQLPGVSSHPLDGILGLGQGKSSIVSQLHTMGVIRNVVGHCLSAKGGGFLFFGDDLYDSSQVRWTPMLRDSSHYSAGSAELILGGKGAGYKNLVVVFDSGSSFTYLSSLAYHSVLSWVKKELNGKPLKDAKDDRALPHCWKGKKPFGSVNDVRKYFKPLALRFDNSWISKPQFEIPPEGYLIISSRGNACLGILNGTEIGLQNYNIIGDISMQDKMVIYDNEKTAIGWTPATCDRPPKSSALPVVM